MEGPACFLEMKWNNIIISVSRNMLAIYSQCVNINEQVTSVCRPTSCHLSNVHCLKGFLRQERLIKSTIDCCNSPLFHMTNHNTYCLQWINNGAVCRVRNTRTFYRITLILLIPISMLVRRPTRFGVLQFAKPPQPFPVLVLPMA